jgi:hypothetical protein
MALEETGDCEVDTAPELMALSEEYDRKQESFASFHLTCHESLTNPPQPSHDWRYGHRPGWFVCAHCNLVCPCGTCYKAELDGRGDWMGSEDDNGKCPYCGRPLGDLILARIREVKAIEEEIEWTRLAFSMAGVGFVDQPPFDWCHTMERPWELLRKMRHIEHLHEISEAGN